MDARRFNTSFFSTIIKAICMIFILHFAIKQLSRPLANQTTNFSRNFSASVNPSEDVDGLSDITDISREDLRRSLQDYVQEYSEPQLSSDVQGSHISNRTNRENGYLEHPTSGGYSSYLPEASAYADYRPLNLSETRQEQPLSLNNEKMFIDPLRNTYEPEKVCNGGPLMAGVFGYDELQDNYSMVHLSPPQYKVQAYE